MTANIGLSDERIMWYRIVKHFLNRLFFLHGIVQFRILPIQLPSNGFITLWLTIIMPEVAMLYAY